MKSSEIKPPILHLSLDSGFIQKKEGLRFLLAKSLTVKSSWEYIKDADTIGKYYKIKETGNFYVCMMDCSDKYMFETHLLLELKPDGTVVKHERFFHWNYPSCWDNNYEGFNKTGNYFSLKICGTGSSFSGRYLYVFKNILPQENQKPIPEGYWSFFEKYEDNLSSTIEFKDDHIIMHYKFEMGTVDDSMNFTLDSTRMFDAEFYLKGQKWITADSNNIGM